MIQKIKHKPLIDNVDKSDAFKADIEFVKIVYGLSEDKVAKMKPKKLDAMVDKMKIQAEYQVPPLLMFYYKGKKFAYYPLELGCIADMIAYELFGKQNKLNALASIFFREVTSDKTDGDWSEACGMRVKFINNFNKQYTQFKVKKIKDITKIDFEFFDDLPYQFIASAINFLMGIGQAYSINTDLYSQKSLKERHKLMLDLMNQYLFGRELQCLLSNLKKEMETSSDTAELNQYYGYLYKLHSTGWYNENLIKQAVVDQTQILMGSDNSIMFSLIDNIYSEKDLTLTSIKTLNNLIKIVHTIGKAKGNG